MSGGWAITVRTRVFDDLLLSTIQDHGLQGVLNLGAGLDTRPYRLDLPARLQWIEVDLPATIEHKERLNRQSLTMRLAWALSPEGKRSEFRRLWTYALLEHRHLPNSD